MMHGQHAHAAWKAMNASSSIPWNALPVTSAGAANYYICRATFEGGQHPGWTKAGAGDCSIGWGGLQYTLSTYQIWVDDWEPASNGKVPANAIPFGQEGPYPAPVTERTRYACQALDPDKGLASGKVAPDIGSCDFGWGGSERYQASYNVLVDSALSMIDSAGGTKATASAANPSTAYAVGPYLVYGIGGTDTVPDSLVSGYEANGGPVLHLCSAYYEDGYQIGKISAVMNGCDLSYGGAEIQGVSPYYILQPNWVSVYGNAIPIARKVDTFPEPTPPGGLAESAIVGGHEANGGELYLCEAYLGGSKSAAVYVPGKTSPSLGGCSVGQNGKETIYPNYRVLGETYTPVSVE